MEPAKVTSWRHSDSWEPELSPSCGTPLSSAPQVQLVGGRRTVSRWMVVLPEGLRSCAPS